MHLTHSESLPAFLTIKCLLTIVTLAWSSLLHLSGLGRAFTLPKSLVLVGLLSHTTEKLGFSRTVAYIIILAGTVTRINWFEVVPYAMSRWHLETSFIGDQIEKKNPAEKHLNGHFVVTVILGMSHGDMHLFFNSITQLSDLLNLVNYQHYDISSFTKIFLFFWRYIFHSQYEMLCGIHQNR